MAGSPDPKAGRIVDRHLTLCAPRGEGYQGQSPWLVRSRNLVDGELLGDAAQGAALCYRAEPAGREQVRGLRMLYDRPGRQDRTRIGETLHARGDVDRPPEIILAII